MLFEENASFRVNNSFSRFGYSMIHRGILLVTVPTKDETNEG
jgi:hypothetical protein